MYADQNGGLVQTDPENGYCNNSGAGADQNHHSAAALEMELQQHLTIEMDHHHSNYSINPNNADIHDLVGDSAWPDLGNAFQPLHHFATTPDAPDLLNIFPFPARLPPQKPPSTGFLASLGFLGDLAPDGSSSSSVYDPLLPLNLPPQPPLLRELFHSLPHGGAYGLAGVRTNGTTSLFGGVGVDDGSAGGIENGVFEFAATEMECLGKNREGKDTKHFATERHRRFLLNDKYQSLRKLVPNPTKNDRASIVEDAINYINELKRTVTELKVLVERKRCAKERLKRPKTEDESIEGNNNDPKSLSEMDNAYNGSPLRSSWLHRKSKNTEVDVRIIDDEVTVKLVQQKRINCLLFVSKVLDEFQLDLHHVAGGLIGDYYSFLFNSKINEGSTVYASAVANKLTEVVDKQYAAILPTTSY